MKPTALLSLLLATAAAAWPDAAHLQVLSKPADIGMVIGGTAGPNGTLTEVTPVEVGHVTLVMGSGSLHRGEGPVRTGVTAIHPRGRTASDAVFAAVHAVNGNGELTGAAAVRETGLLVGPIVLTNGFSIGIARDATIGWMASEQDAARLRHLAPVVGGVTDQLLSDAAGFHVTEEHVHQALEIASAEPVVQGNVGAGTGSVCFGFKAGIGSASRVLDRRQGGYTLSALVVCNFGQRPQLVLGGRPVGALLQGFRACRDASEPPTRTFLTNVPDCDADETVPRYEPLPGEGQGSYVLVVATDAPLLPHQLERLARQASMAVGRLGAGSLNVSGDFVVAFSTANPGLLPHGPPRTLEALTNEGMNGLFRTLPAVVEEAIVMSLLRAEDMTGADGLRIPALPIGETRRLLSR